MRPLGRVVNTVLMWRIKHSAYFKDAERKHADERAIGDLFFLFVDGTRFHGVRQCNLPPFEAGVRIAGVWKAAPY
jgi:hypothetical protein